MTLTELEKLQNVDPVTVDRSSLVEITDIEIDRSLPKKARIQDYFRQIKNPYCYLQNGVVVKISFAGKESFESCVSRCITQSL